MAGHILPLVATIAIWFFATGLVAWLDNRDRATFPVALIVAGIAGVLGLAMVVIAASLASAVGAYLGFGGAMLVWAWHEMSFLMGAVAGPRREPARPEARGWDRFVDAGSTLIYHEIALAVTALLLISLTWTAPNPLGAQVFCLLFALRLASKLNIFLGVPNMSDEILPPHLAYLKSYFGPRRFTALLAATIAATAALAAWLGAQALAAAPHGADAVALSLLFTLAALGVVEHIFLALPFRDGALWGWALPGQKRAKSGA
ncbi:putative photosynthetic complex assembly protein PuhE [Novosphingobium sp. Gsoil 351]|uniref:putative photosynthetic complex assembly protein PuhE n=1 Tax=Novosphingobium sp. Gsoil 351 TaxID=2675225 RepID=UPI00351B0497